MKVAVLVLVGVLIQFFDWRATFLFTAAIGLLGLVGNQVEVPESRDETAAPVDWAGGVLATLGLAGVVFAIMEAPSRGIGDPLIIATLGGGLVSLAAFVLWELRSRHPLLDVRMFRSPMLGLTTVSITMTFFAMMGAFFGMSQILQLVMGFSALGSALAMIPCMLPMMFLSPLSP
jgi:MFS family permease